MKCRTRKENRNRILTAVWMVLVLTLTSLPLPPSALVAQAASVTITKTFWTDGSEGRTMSEVLDLPSGTTVTGRSVSASGTNTALIQYTSEDTLVSASGVLSYKVGSGAVGNTENLQITLTLIDANGANSTYVVTLKVTIGQLTPTGQVTTSSSYTYGVTSNDISYSTAFSDPVTGANVAGTLTWDDKGTKAIQVANTGLAYTFTPTNTAKYKTVKGKATVNIVKATPNVATPVVADMTYDAGKTLSSISIKSTGGSWVEAGKTVNVSGKWEFLNPNQVATVNVSSYACVFKPSDSKNYNEVTAVVTIKVNKATPKLTTKPNITPITVGETLAEAKFSGGVASCSGTFYWENQSIKPTIADSGKTKFEYYFVPYDTMNYDIYRDSITVTVNKISDVPNTPKDMSVGFGVQTVSEVMLPENWVWNAEDAKKEIKAKGDSVVATAEYVGKDKDNYLNIKKPIILKKSGCYHNSFTYRYSKVATCTGYGYQGDRYCKVCNTYIGNGELIEPLGHNYVSSITARPTSNTSGARTYRCSRCKQSYNERFLSLSENSNGVLTLKPVLDENVNTACVTLSMADVETAIETSADRSLTVNVYPISGTEYLKARKTGVTLTDEVQKKLVSAEVPRLLINMLDVKLSLDASALSDILKQAAGTVTIILENATGENVRPVFDISIVRDDDSKITKFSSAGLVLTIPYTRQRVNDKGEVSESGSYEEIEKIKALYTDDNGRSTFLQESSYNETTSSLIIPTDHLSTYAVGYQTKSPTDQSGTILRVKSSAGKNQIKLSWNAVDEAESYIIYGAKTGSSYKKLAEVTTTSYTHESLKKGTAYKYYVKACRTQENEPVTISTSYKLYVVTSGGQYSNQISFKASPQNIVLNVGATQKLKVTYKTTKKLKKFTSYVRYQSSDVEVAGVSSSGTITAKKKGTCYIYIYGQNGYKTSVKVTIL